MALFFKKRTPAPAYEAAKAPVKTNTNPYEAKKEDKEPVYETVKKPSKKEKNKKESSYEAKKPSKGNDNPYKA